MNKLTSFTLAALLLAPLATLRANDADPQAVFQNPPESAKPGVLWMWMGCNLSREGITRDLGVVWTAPWGVEIPQGLLKPSGNKLEIEVTNVWANRLIGDEQEPPDCEWLPGHHFANQGGYLKRFPDWFVKKEPRPSKGRYCFTTWNYFTKDSPLIPSGLLGPVTISSAK